MLKCFNTTETKSDTEVCPNWSSGKEAICCSFLGEQSHLEKRSLRCFSSPSLDRLILTSRIPVVAGQIVGSSKSRQAGDRFANQLQTISILRSFILWFRRVWPTDPAVIRTRESRRISTVHPVFEYWTFRQRLPSAIATHSACKAQPSHQRLAYCSRLCLGRRISK